jgi:hypothetical protein
MRRLPIAVAVLIALGVGGVVLWQERLTLATTWIDRALDRHGLGPASLTIDALWPDGIAARDIVLRGGAIRAASFTASFTPLAVLQGHVADATLDGLTAALAVTAQGISAEGRPIAPAGGAGGGLRVDTLHLAGARLSLATPDGPIETDASAMLHLAADRLDVSGLAADIRATIVGTRRELRLSAQRLTLRKGEGGFDGSISGAALATAAPPFVVQDLAANLSWRRGRAEFQLASATLVVGGTLAPSRPIKVSGSATMEGSTIGFAARAIIDAAGNKGSATFTVTGEHDWTKGVGAAHLGASPITFRSGGLQPADFLPILAGAAQDIVGTVSLQGPLRWGDGKLSPDLALRLAGFGFARSGVSFRPIDGVVRINSLWPLTTPANQKLTIGIAAAGLPPATAHLRFELRKKSLLHIQELALDVAGGTISATGVDIDTAAPASDVELAVDRVNLAPIVQLLGIDGLSGSGVLSGHIPLRFGRGGFVVSAGRLTAIGPGVLRYAPQQLPQQIASAGKSVALALEALADFHYRSLTLGLDKRASGEGTVLLQLAGNNPAVLNGHAFDINIRVEANFDRLVDYAMLGLSSADELLRRARGRFGK